MFRPKIKLILCLALLTFMAGCSKEETLRHESIFPYLEAEAGEEVEELKVLDVDFRGMKGSIYIESNVDYEVTFQQNVHNHDMDWIKFSEVHHDNARNCDVIDFEARPMKESLKRLHGILNLSSKDNYYGKFIVIRQGFNARYSNDFSFLKFGSRDPLVSGNERPFESWYEDQRENNPFETTVIEGQEHSHFYGRNGFVQMGNLEGYGADVTIPYVKEIVRDTAIVVSLNALAMPGDNDELTLEILGGGVFDGTTETVRTFKAEQFATGQSIWEGSMKYWVISSLDDNKITTDTRIKVTAGKLEKMDHSNRILLDNINVFSLPRECFDLVLAGGEKKPDTNN